ncbi:MULTISPECIES: hypothetical protein [Entomomonas]|uniref:RiboL-PSP-HEPN domain-containing protein n=1 Tax=Entomomonas asaccharolytica TaxID=2785331 RepID=A0A974NHK4_9GAMM|nr:MULTISPECIES: hypothetical protein [Entomomonas]QQP86891.1 hypothetical protein JHT90_06515 [Entomomonas asaccharolytica]UYZ83489.1 hypothetical protein MTZ49_12935 [Entomomonas sp. E2T0]
MTIQQTVTKETYDFLKKFESNFCSLPNEELLSINSFSLLWMLFENRLLNKSASAQKIIDKVNELKKDNKLSSIFWMPHLNYFQNRYISNDGTNYLFDDLYFRKPDKKELVKAVLLGETNEPEETLAAILIIVLRLRNNLFHGEKWSYGIRDQQDNFKQSIDLLISCLTRFIYEKDL